MNITINKKPKSLVEIDGSIDVATFESYREQAIEYIGKDYEIDGFRKGAVPKALLEKKIPEMYILEEMAQRAIESAYRKALIEHEIPAIGQPKVTIKKIGKGNPLEFSVEVATIPEITLPDYKKIAGDIKKSATEEVTDTELENTLLEVQKMHAHRESHGTEPHEHEEGKEEDYPLPELTDEFAQKLGDFKTVDDLKNKIKENLTLEKEGKRKSKDRAMLIDALIEKTTIEVPDMLVEYELDRFMMQMRSDIERMGLSYDEYLKHLTKTEVEMRESYKQDTEKKVKTEFILAEIGKQEKIDPDEKKVGEQVEYLMKAYHNVDKENVENYVKNTLQIDAVIEYLEGLMK